MRGSVLRLLCLTGFGTALAFGCSVFPDKAVLPLSEDAGAGPGPGEAGANTAGDSSNAGAGPTAGAGNASQGGSVSGGTSSNGGDGATAGTGATTGGSEPLGGAPDGGVGGVGGRGGSGGNVMGGTAGMAGCVPMMHEVKVTGDTWIESNKPNTNHVLDKQLFVVGGIEERRVLLSFDLPAVSSGSKLNSAILKLKLQSNADMTKVSRLLELHVVSRAVNEVQATWLNWEKGVMGKWTVPGGDFGPVEAAQSLKAGTTTGQVRFDVSQVVRPLLKTKSVPLDLLVAEGGIAPEVPAELAFMALEGDASGYPVLSLDTCEP